MSKTRTAAEMRAYQRARRERLRASTGTVTVPAPVAARIVEPPARTPIHRDIPGEALEHRLVRQRVTRKWINPFGDGLPDTGELIARMTQARRDEILGRMARASRG